MRWWERRPNPALAGGAAAGLADADGMMPTGTRVKTMSPAAASDPVAEIGTLPLWRHSGRRVDVDLMPERMSAVELTESIRAPSRSGSPRARASSSVVVLITSVVTTAGRNVSCPGRPVAHVAAEMGISRTTAHMDATPSPSPA